METIGIIEVTKDYKVLQDFCFSWVAVRELNLN